MRRDSVKPLTIWVARIVLPLMILPALLFAAKLAISGQIYQALGLAGMQSLFVFWMVKAWAK